MVWEDLLFAHWPVAPDRLRARLPRGLDLDLFDGRAWLGIVPFAMRGVRPRLAPALPGLSAFLELNVRTYVRGPDGRAGVWFFSLDANHALAVAVARTVFALRYLRARIACRSEGGWIDYGSDRTDRRAPPARLRVRYRPTAGTLGDDPLRTWLTERYCMYMSRPLGAAEPRALYRGDVHHAPWSLQPAVAEFTCCTMAGELGVELAGEPFSHFSRRLEVVAWAPQRVAQQGT